MAIPPPMAIVVARYTPAPMPLGYTTMLIRDSLELQMPWHLGGSAFGSRESVALLLDRVEADATAAEHPESALALRLLVDEPRGCTGGQLCLDLE
jgi:hypothetical protein